jgi:hypothetical protein
MPSVVLPASGLPFAVDQISSVYFTKAKLVLGADGTASYVSIGQQLKAASVPVALASDHFGQATKANSLSIVHASDEFLAHDVAAATEVPNRVLGAFGVDAVTTVVTDNRKTRVYADRAGRLTVTEVAPGNMTSGTASTNTNTDTACIAAPGAGRFLYLTDVTLCNESATNCRVEIKNNSGLRHVIYVPSLSTVWRTFKTPIRASAANTSFSFHPQTGVSTLYCSMTGFWLPY